MVFLSCTGFICFSVAPRDTRLLKDSLLWVGVVLSDGRGRSMRDFE